MMLMYMRCIGCVLVECRLGPVRLSGECSENLTPIPADALISQVRSNVALVQLTISDVMCVHHVACVLNDIDQSSIKSLNNS